MQPDPPRARDRAAELAASLGAVRGRIAAACQSAGRDAGAVTLIAVTKTYPAQDLATLVRLGVSDIGENKDQEAAAKVRTTAQLLAESGDGHAATRWHFVGQLQRRKARSVATYAHAVHSVDRSVLVPLLADAVDRADRAPLDVFVQLSLDGDPNRGGLPADEVPALAEAVAAREQLVLRGLMAVVPIGVDPDVAFAVLADESTRLSSRHPGAIAISAGMSGDFEAAVRHGATHLRVGTALLGRRKQTFG